MNGPQMTLGIPVTFQIPGAAKRGSGITIMDANGGSILVAVATFDGTPPSPNNGLINLPVSFLVPVAMTSQQKNDNMCKALLLYLHYEQTGELSNNPMPTTPEQRAAVQVYIQKYGRPTGP